MAEGKKWNSTMNLKLRVWKRDRFTCQYCGLNMSKLYKLWKDKKIKRSKALITVDHIIPISYGGQWTEENLVTACRECNLAKGKQSVITFLRNKHKKI